MRTSRYYAPCLVLVSSLAAVGAAHAVLPLQGRDINGNAVEANAADAVMEYDPNLSITWLRDWDKNGMMDWGSAKTWVSALTVGSYGGWMLPSALNQDGTGPCEGDSNCTGSPLGFMYYAELGNVASPPTGYGMANKGPFQNVRADYWSGTQLATDRRYAWEFNTALGIQIPVRQHLGFHAVAVRLGDVAAVVPETQTWALMLTGLGSVAVALRRRSLWGVETSGALIRSPGVRVG